MALLLLGAPVIVVAQSFQLPDYTSFTLENGLVVNLMEQHDVPVIGLTAILPAGAIYDAEKAGLAALTADALKLGTKNYSKTQLDEALDFVGASVYTSARKEYASLNAKFAAKDKDEVLNIIKDILIYPTFDASAFDTEKNRALVAIEQQKESPRRIIDSYFDVLLYGDHVYGNIPQGTAATVGALNASDAEEFYKNNYSPNGASLNIVGDFSSMEMKTMISNLFSAWKKSSNQNENLASKPLSIPTVSNVLLVNKEDAKETTFYIGALGVGRNNPDFVDISIINTLFGGRFTSMLNDELRVNSGLTYGARSRFESLKYGGSFAISTFTANETTEAALDKALEVLNALHSKGLDEKSLTSAKNYVKGQFPPRYETVMDLSGLLGDMFWYDLDKTYINTFEKKVDELDLKKANEIIETYFPKDTLQIVLIGKASEIKEIAEKYGNLNQIEINSYPKE
ncbi:insulinase family protein [Subsaximicrobium wynnwilliamsii]|uniref:Insulinase family protein n=2 Tax=Subsaximicrobium wynnwilliamsii TaxID=291179 RepID=A0A5C6ZI76_9FLAO|nr:insulinase family protein [Subsaximicrobium wynnwilliamsii]TXD89159.1 insulinase family protein [Subsaximicrobium wynnwilliamsii]TXE03419.1 insulinase family protein [Subsaximicrobium wynnwilliamsii]